MKYSINKTNYNDFCVYEINKLKPRAYFIPFSSESVLNKTDYKSERYSSDIVDVLSGKWDFVYFGSTTLLPEEIDTDNFRFDEVTVPSTWQRTGYEPPVYLNVRYPFEGVYNSIYPQVPDNSCGVYRKKFTIKNADKKHIITFLGVISSLDLYVNGKFVGYSEGAHNSAEFDISDYVTEGENELLAVVFKWTNATYLECQDMFRENGIFRDVYITENDSTYIYDLVYRAKKNDDSTYSLTLDCKFGGSFEGCTASLKIYDGDNLLAKTDIDSDTDDYVCHNDRYNYYLNFASLDVVEWSAEKPKTYSAVFTLEKDGKTQVVRTLIGFKTIEIRKDVYYFNNQPVKLKGVNHHDTNPEKGYVMSSDDILKDINLMKELNVNTVRTSHYPPDPFFIIACTVKGIYVCDEADIETHGCGSFLDDICAISDDPMWMPRYVDRVKRMLFRDRNNPCIAMWSLGNEAGNGVCHDAAYGILKAECPEIPVHYEGALSSTRVAYDIASNMYPPVDSYYGYDLGNKYVKKLAINEDKPYFLCEYAHAMGIGPGALEEYWDAIYSSDKFMGGCIWEWADHAACTYSEKYKYTYGGDHGEKLHDGNFCVDGLIYPDRTPHTGALEMKAVYRPIRAEYYNGNRVFFTNTNYFTNANEYDIKWDLLENGKVIKSGEMKIDIPPHSKKMVSFDIPDNYFGNDYHLNITYFKDGFEIAKEQLKIHEVYTKIKSRKQGELKLSETDKTYKIEFDGGHLDFCKKCGEISSYVARGKEIICQSPADNHRGFAPNVWRAYHDNEKYRMEYWISGELSKAYNKLVSFEVKNSSNKIVAKSEYEIKTDEKVLFGAEVIYTVHPGGKIHIDTALTKKANDEIPNEIPRFGLNIEMDKSFENIEYYGRGDRENLSDFKAHTTVGIYSAKVSDTHEPYIYPQENGYHTEVRYLTVTDNEGDGVIFCNAKDNFSFNIHDYTVKSQLEAMHQEEIVKSDSTVLNLDGFLGGTGTGSCGPYTLERYRVFCDKPLSFSFDMIPLKNIK